MPLVSVLFFGEDGLKLEFYLGGARTDPRAFQERAFFLRPRIPSIPIFQAPALPTLLQIRQGYVLLKSHSTENLEVSGPKAILHLADLSDLTFLFSAFFGFFRQRASFGISIKIKWLFSLQPQAYLLNGTLILSYFSSLIHISILVYNLL